MSPTLGKAYGDGAKASADDLSLDTFDQWNERASKYASERGAELVGMRYNDAGELVQNPNAEWAITEPTRDALRDLETKAFDEGWSARQFQDAIEDLIDDPARAATIAETELSMAQSEGSLEEWKESGVVQGKESILGSEHGSDDICDENAEAGVIGIDEEFPSGDQTAPYHARCVCAVAAVVAGEE